MKKSDKFQIKFKKESDISRNPFVLTSEDAKKWNLSSDRIFMPNESDELDLGQAMKDWKAQYLGNIDED